jgi:hypothetical protein
MKKHGFALGVGDRRVALLQCDRVDVQLTARHEQALVGTIALRIRISLFGDANEKCSDSNHLDPLSASRPFTPPSTTPSMSSVISFPTELSAPSEMRR